MKNAKMLQIENPFEKYTGRKKSARGENVEIKVNLFEAKKEEENILKGQKLKKVFPIVPADKGGKNLLVRRFLSV